MECIVGITVAIILTKICIPKLQRLAEIAKIYGKNS
jgi:hypothetical protein